MLSDVTSTGSAGAFDRMKEKVGGGQRRCGRCRRVCCLKPPVQAAWRSHQRQMGSNGYAMADLKGKGLEVVFVSGDRDEGSFKEYFGEQPWLSVDFNDKATTEKLNKTFKVKGIPSLVILDGDGKLITTEGRAAVSKDPTGEKLPWLPVVLDSDFNVVTLEGRGAVSADPTGAELPWHPKPAIWMAAAGGRP
eukprot:Skav215583  [mRNA]  locus=scaffold666:56875:69943:+ [translate_table: standard]